VRFALSHANGDSYCYSYRYRNVYAYARTHGYRYRDIYAYARTNSYGYSNVYAYARTNGYGYRYVYAWTNGNGYCYCYCDGNVYANAHSDTLHVARGPERASRNQRDFQQLYRELEQRKRCDRLSVGRLYKQHFHHLRTWLPGFGCRKRDQLCGDRVKREHDLLLPNTILQWVCYKPQFQRQNFKDVGLHACGSERTKRN
jgi:hypothetical protein